MEACLHLKSSCNLQYLSVTCIHSVLSFPGKHFLKYFPFVMPRIRFSQPGIDLFLVSTFQEAQLTQPVEGFAAMFEASLPPPPMSSFGLYMVFMSRWQLWSASGSERPRQPSPKQLKYSVKILTNWTVATKASCQGKQSSYLTQDYFKPMRFQLALHLTSATIMRN